MVLLLECVVICLSNNSIRFIWDTLIQNLDVMGVLLLLQLLIPGPRSVLLELGEGRWVEVDPPFI